MPPAKYLWDLWGVLCAFGLASLACSQAAAPPGSGGQSARGGTVSAGGTAGSSVVGTGGVTGSGGESGSGGRDASGGTLGGGGGGGTLGTGGTRGTGGTLGSGGVTAGTGGLSVQSGGGTRSSGGAAGGGNGGMGPSGGRPGGGTGAGGARLDGGGTGGTGAGGARLDGGGSGGSGAGGATRAPVTIVPGAVWNDTQGKVIQAHGEGIIKVGDTYYWLGEDKTNGSAFQNINCYSSTDLKTWTFVNNVLTRQASGDLGPNRVIERPHVIYNASTSQYVMYMHVDNSNYTDRKAGVATCSTVCGAYTYRGSSKPLGHDSLDDTLFQDGTAGYFLSEDRTNTKLQIYRLSDDYLTVSTLVTSLPQYESPAVVKIDGTYFIFGSHLTGWSTNDNQYSTATAMAGPWAAWKSFAPSGTNTCNSQTTFILPVTGSSGTTYVFLGDRWNSGNLTDSRYIWLPLTIKGTTVSMTCATSWTLDVAAGTWSP
jgi:hypothetical protein